MSWLLWTSSQADRGLSVSRPNSQNRCRNSGQRIFSRFGITFEFHTDQGKNFDCGLMRRPGQLLGWTKTRKTPYHPSSNGLVERFNRTLLQMMRCFVSQSKDNWDEHLLTVHIGVHLTQALD